MQWKVGVYTIILSKFSRQSEGGPPLPCFCLLPSLKAFLKWTRNPAQHPPIKNHILMPFPTIKESCMYAMGSNSLHAWALPFGKVSPSVQRSFHSSIYHYPTVHSNSKRNDVQSTDQSLYYRSSDNAPVFARHLNLCLSGFQSFSPLTNRPIILEFLMWWNLTHQQDQRKSLDRRHGVHLVTR